MKLLTLDTTGKERSITMSCVICSAAVLAPLIEGGVSVRKIGNRARETFRKCELSGEVSGELRTAIENLANIADLLAAELARVNSN